MVVVRARSSSGSVEEEEGMGEFASPKRSAMASLRLQSPTSPLFLGSNDDQLERAQARAARAAAGRRKTAAPPPPTDPSDLLNKEQISELFQNCIKLASENVGFSSLFFFFGNLFFVGGILKSRVLLAAGDGWVAENQPEEYLGA